MNWYGTSLDALIEHVRDLAATGTGSSFHDVLAERLVELRHTEGKIEAQRAQILGLEERIRMQRHALRWTNENNELRNKQLDAFHMVWCDGGCGSGMHRWTEESVDVDHLDELIALAEANLMRMRRYVANARFRAARKAAHDREDDPE